MKRVACLLLCAVLLLGLLPAAALADGERKLYFEQCDADGTPGGDGRVSGMDVSYGDTVYFRAYTGATDGVTERTPPKTHCAGSRPGRTASTRGIPKS